MIFLAFYLMIFEKYTKGAHFRIILHKSTFTLPRGRMHDDDFDDDGDAGGPTIEMTGV